MNRHSNQALDVSEQGMQDGANIQQWSYADQPNQNWDVIDLGNREVAIVSRHSGRALTVQGETLFGKTEDNQTPRGAPNFGSQAGALLHNSADYIERMDPKRSKMTSPNAPSGKPTRDE
jgi:hypothetical protein